MKRKVCLITGGNAGIGKEAAILIAKSGAKVIIGCRNEKRGEAALEEIKNRSKSQHVELMIIDLSSRSSIKQAVDEFKSTYSTLDVLIHNAADFDISRKSPEYSEDDIETVWATNHVGPVLLTDLLMDELRRSEQGRILTVASKGLMVYPLLKVDCRDPEFRQGNYSVQKAYYRSKLAQIMYTYWLAEKLKDTELTVNCIRVTNVKIDINRYPNISNVMKRMYSVKSRFSISAEKMAETYAYLALSPEVSAVTGKYFNEKNEIVTSSSYSLDKNSIESVMKTTRQYTHAV